MKEKWYPRSDSNRRDPAPEAGAFPLDYEGSFLSEFVQRGSCTFVLMGAIQKACRVPNIVKSLDVKFLFDPMGNTSRKPFGKPGWNSCHQTFNCIVEARIWSTDNEVSLQRVRHSLAHMRNDSRGPHLFWDPSHCIDSLINEQRELKIYKNFGLKEARAACRFVNERIAMLIAPPQKVWIQEANLAIKMMEAAWEFIVTHDVMAS